MINYWGIFFTFGIPAILWGLGLYFAGIEKGLINKGNNRRRYNGKFTESI